MPCTEDTETQSLPTALWVWNNDARTSLSPGLMAWLGLLVLTCLASVFFVRHHVAARWILCGFITSHIIVFALPGFRVTVRRGLVSLLHVVCWSPGWVFVIVDLDGRSGEVLYTIWSFALIAIVSVSFIFDFQDAATYLYYRISGKVPRESRKRSSAAPK